jgi:hypothetical protein
MRSVCPNLHRAATTERTSTEGATERMCPK